MVYTPVKGMTSGGHFLLYDTLHLTELTRAFDSSLHPEDKFERADLATNADHHSTGRQILRMALALPRQVHAKGASSL
jgi:hypothetical protein